MGSFEPDEIETFMKLDDPAFHEAVQGLRELASTGARLSVLLEFAKSRAPAGNTILACALFYRAFTLPIGVAKSLGAWTGFAAEVGNPGRTAEELDAEYGHLIRRR